MPEIQTTDITTPVPFPETSNKKIHMMEFCRGEDIYRYEYEEKENDRNNDREETKFMKLSTVRDNIQSAHEKIMNGHYEEILSDRDPQSWQTQNNNNKVDQNGDDTTETNGTSENDEIKNENETEQNNCDSHEKKGARRLTDLISKDVLEILSQEQCDKIANDVIHCYDPRVYHPIRPGQRQDEVNVPIMSPPPTEAEAKYELGEFRTNFCRSLAAEFIKEHDLKACKFASVQTEHLLKTLAFPSDTVGKPECICASQNVFDDSLSGWGTPPKFSKSKSAKKRKSSRFSSETAFLRLTGQLIYDKDPFSFQHFKDSRKFIEHYRFLHTVGGVCSERPLTTKSTLSRNTEEELYYNKLRSAFWLVCHLFPLLI